MPAKRIGVLALAALLVGAVLPRPVLAQEAGLPGLEAPGVSQPDKATLDALTRDLGLSLLPHSSGGTTLRVPLAPPSSRLGGLQPYAAVSPLAMRPGGDLLAGVAMPDRSFDDLSRGLGIGAGVTLHLSERVDLYGQYLFRALPGSGTGNLAPTLRPDAESTGLKGGFSLHF